MVDQILLTMEKDQNNTDQVFRGCSLGNIPYLKFEKGNSIRFFQDFSVKFGVPDNVMFFPESTNHDSVVFMADGYGIRSENKWDLKGRYGNGLIYILKSSLPAEIVKWCEDNALNGKNNPLD